MTLSAPTPTPAELDARILAVVRSIPRGCVLSYGEVARRAGMPRGARRVARALAANSDPELPWHRVLRAGGVIAFPAGSAGFREQSARLRADGVRLRGARVEASAPAADLDHLLWGRPPMG